MIIHVKREKGVIKLNQDFASAVPEFADILEDERLGVNYMAYVAYVVDSAEDNIWCGLPEDIRKKEVSESLKLDKALLKDTKVVSALKKYRQFCEQNISYQFKEAHTNGMKKIADYVKRVETLDDDSAKKFAEVLDKMPSLLDGKGKIEKIQTKDTNRGSAKGGRQPTLNELG